MKKLVLFFVLVTASSRAMNLEGNPEDHVVVIEEIDPEDVTTETESENTWQNQMSPREIMEAIFRCKKCHKCLRSRGALTAHEAKPHKRRIREHKNNS